MKYATSKNGQPLTSYVQTTEPAGSAKDHPQNNTLMQTEYTGFSPTSGSIATMSDTKIVPCQKNRGSNIDLADQGVKVTSPLRHSRGSSQNSQSRTYRISNNSKSKSKERLTSSTKNLDRRKGNNLSPYADRSGHSLRWSKSPIANENK